MATSYDEVPYPSHPFAETRPAHLATVAHLLGVPTPNPDACTVLEIGCASGGNLIPLAVASPRSSFVGVDLSQRQVDEGRQRVAQLGLQNVELLHLDLTKIAKDFGLFDYIICHGVYSWVPREAQDHILHVCRHNLTEHGVAYVSYNTYPGWHLMTAIREMMLYHTERFAAPKARIAQARAFLDFLARWIPARDDAYAMLLKTEAKALRNKSDAYLFHEHLESINDPIYFSEFLKRIEAADLQYLGETKIRAMLSSELPAEVTESLRLLAPDPHDFEQYLDFLRNRTFRRTLLCHKNVRVDHSLNGKHAVKMSAACHLRPESPQVEIQEGLELKFVDYSGGVLTTKDRLMKAALLSLGEQWPAAMSVAELAAAMRERLEPLDDALQNELQPPNLAKRLQHYYIHNIIELHLVPPAVARSVGEFPEASLLARLQARDDQWVTNLRHQSVKLSPNERKLITILDGTQEAKQLVAPHDAESATSLQTIARKSLLMSKPQTGESDDV